MSEWNRLGYTLGIRLVYDWYTGGIRLFLVVYDGIRLVLWWYTMVYGWYCGGIRWYTAGTVVVYDGIRLVLWVVYDWYTIGIRLVYHW